ncbi:Uma2 family endonuclease [bacterium]|nr:Uma2 family endonuclease [bacterium]
MSALPQLARLTHAEYFALEQAGDLKHEYVDGYVYAMAGASQKHIDISDNLFAALFAGLKGGTCRTSHSDVRVYVEAADSFFYPDVVVTCDERDRQPDQDFICYPCLVVEILSETTEAFDRGAKFADYARVRGKPS